MQLLPFVAFFALICFVESYGIQARKRWAWYGGWVMGFFFAGGVCSQALPLFLNVTSVSDVIAGSVFTIGGLCVWTFWAVWWATHRKMFSGKKTTARRGVRRA